MQGRRESSVQSRGQAHRVRRCFRSRASTLAPRFQGAFTLLELMMVVAIIGMMMAMGVPAILRTMHQEPLRKAVNDVMNICSHARAQAILHSVTTTVVFHPRSGEVALNSIAGTNATDRSFELDASERKAVPGAATLNSARFGDEVVIDMLDVNLTEYKDADEARVRFFPNGTSDEMTLILHSGNQYRKISLEVTTGLAYLQVIR